MILRLMVDEDEIVQAQLAVRQRREDSDYIEEVMRKQTQGDTTAVPIIVPVRGELVMASLIDQLPQCSEVHLKVFVQALVTNGLLDRFAPQIREALLITKKS